jgi:hypothetical protein
MAVKSLNILENDPVFKKAVVELYADTKQDIVPGMVIQDFPPDYSIEIGSVIVTGNFEIAIMTSEGWHWK